MRARFRMLAATAGLASCAAVLPWPAGPARAAASASTQAPARPSVMILLDANDSLAGSGISAERKAALAYARALPATAAAGLIVFSERWHLAVPPTTNRRRLAAALAAARPAGATSAGIASALPAAVAALRQRGMASGDRLLVLSDAEELTGRLTAAIPVDVVTWYYESDDRLAVLRSVAARSGGRSASPAHAATLAAVVPAAPVASAAPAESAPARTPAPTAATPPPAKSTAHVAFGGPLLITLVLVFVALSGLALLVLGSLRKRDRSRLLGAQLERYGPRRAPAPGDAEGTVARTTVGGVTRLLQATNVEGGLAHRLDLAGIARKPAEWVVLGCSGGLVLIAALTMLAGSLLLGAALGILITWLGMRIVVSGRIGRRRRAFASQLPDVLQLVASSLQAGFSLPQALDAVVREGSQPAAEEFSRALAATRIGAGLEDSLDRVADRMESTDLRWTVMAIRIQREVGGNLAEVLRNTVATMRERAALRRHVRALSAEGRLSAYILIALPVLIGGWLFFASPSYMRPLYTTLPGMVMLIGGMVLVVIGSLWMRKIIKVEM